MNLLKLFLNVLFIFALFQMTNAQGAYSGTVTPLSILSNGTFITFNSTTQYTPSFSTYRLVFYQYNSLAPNAPLSQCIMPLPCTNNNISTTTFRTVNSTISINQLLNFCNATSVATVSGPTTNTYIRFTVYLQRYDYQTCNTCGNAANCRLTAVSTLDARYITYILSYGNVFGTSPNSASVSVINDVAQTPITYTPTSAITLCNPANANVDSVQLTNTTFAAVCIIQTIENFVTPLDVSCTNTNNITLSIKFSSGPNTVKISTPYTPCNAPSTLGSVIPVPSVTASKTTLDFSSTYTTNVTFYLVLTIADIVSAGIPSCTSPVNCLVPPTSITLSSIIYGMNPTVPFAIGDGNSNFAVMSNTKTRDVSHNKYKTQAGIPFDVPNSNVATAFNTINLSLNKSACMSANCTSTINSGSSSSDSCDSSCKLLIITFSIFGAIIITLFLCYKCNVNGSYGSDDDDLCDNNKRCNVEMNNITNRNRV